MFSKVAIIVEWDNARLSELDRAREMLRRLGEQAGEVARTTNATFDLMLLFDPEEVPQEIPIQILAECIDETKWPGKISLTEVHGLPYYDQKNFGVKQTDADVILFVDSDVVPEEGWLGYLMEAMKDPSVQVVSGETYLSTDSFVDRVYAGFWLFDPKKPARGLYEAGGFYANNLAFRAQLIRDNPFPTLPTYRGQCTALAKALKSQGVKLMRDGRAQVSHPPPQGFSHFVNRAVCAGHDIMLQNQSKAHAWLRANPVTAVGRFFRDTAKAPRRIFRRRQGAGLGPAEMVSAFGMAVAYNAARLFGELAAFVSPAFVRRHFEI
jgi:hypothetical protein